MSEQGGLVPWLHRRIRERMYLATHAMELGNAAEWSEMTSGVLVTARPDNPQDDPHDRWDGVHAIGDSSLTRLMAANDPRDTIARCEFELAVLDEHATVRRGQDEDFFRRGLKVIAGRMPPGVGLVTIGEFAGDFGCVTCHYERGGHVQGFGYCNTVRLLGRAYRFEDGYREAEWKP